MHGALDMRVITRLSSDYAGSVPILRVSARSATMPGMEAGTRIDVAALKRAVIAATGPGKQFTRRSLSLAASGNKNPDLIRDLISRGQDRKVSFDTAVGIAAALGVDVGQFIAGGVAASGKLDAIRVIGAVEAGAWRECEQWDDDRQFEIVAQPAQIAGAVRFGLEVVGYSMDRVFLPGTILDCLRIPDTPDLQPIAGDIVIVQRRRGDLFETTCKRLERTEDGSYQLRAESSRPEFTAPIPIGKPDNGHFADEDICIIGIVNSAITRVFQR